MLILQGITLLRDRVAIVPDDDYTQIGMLYVPDMSRQPSQEGYVVAASATLGDLLGQKVIFHKYAGDQVEILGKLILIIHISDILATLERLEIPR